MEGTYLYWKNNPDSLRYEKVINFINKLIETRDRTLLVDFVKLIKEEIVTLKDWRGSSILHKLMEHPMKEIIQLFFKEMIELRNDAGNTPLHFLAIHLRQSPSSKEVTEILDLFSKPINKINYPLKDLYNDGIWTVPARTPYDYLSYELKCYYCN